MISHKESIDTNVLLRIILGDNPDQRTLALELLERPATTFYLSSVAIMEVAFVLEKIIGYTREEISESLTRVLGAYNNIEYDEKTLRNALEFYVNHPSLSFDDCYLAEEAAQKNCEPLWTFDHKLATQSPTAKELK